MTGPRPATNAPTTIDRTVILLTTLIGGAMSSLVKSGTEPNMPPRVPGEVSPPAAHLDAWLGRAGIDWHALYYVYQTVRVPGAVMLYHLASATSSPSPMSRWQRAGGGAALVWRRL